MTAYSFQVTIVSREPHVLAEWWAGILGWSVELQDEEFIRRMITEGLAIDDDTAVHRGRIVWKDGVAMTHPDGTDRAPRVYFQLVPEGKIVKNRMHFDVRLGDDDLEAVLLKSLTGVI